MLGERKLIEAMIRMAVRDARAPRACGDQVELSRLQQEARAWLQEYAPEVWRREFGTAS